MSAQLLFAQTEGELGALLAVAGLFMLIGLAVAIVVIAGMWKTFEKCGEPGWAAIIPIYNLFVLAKVGNREQLGIPIVIAAVVSFIPVIGLLGSIAVLVLLIMIALGVGERFNKSPGWSVAFLAIFSFIGYPILGFGDAQPAPAGATAGGFGAGPAPQPGFGTPPGAQPQQQPPPQQPDQQGNTGWS